MYVCLFVCLFGNSPLYIILYYIFKAGDHRVPGGSVINEDTSPGPV